jgi:hypothetical protein
MCRCQAHVAIQRDTGMARSRASLSGTERQLWCWQKRGPGGYCPGSLRGSATEPRSIFRDHDPQPAPTMLPTRPRRATDPAPERARHDPIRRGPQLSLVVLSRLNRDTYSRKGFRQDFVIDKAVNYFLAFRASYDFIFLGILRVIIMRSLVTGADL